MPPQYSTALPLSPAELSYLHTSLSFDPPIRPDGRTATQFRPLIAETDVLPSANGSARICFADGTEAVVGVKCEVERSPSDRSILRSKEDDVKRLVTGGGDEEMRDESSGGEDDEVGNGSRGRGEGRNEWVEMAIEIPGYRDDDALPVFLSAMITEALVSDGELKNRLYINQRFHWRLYIDILLLSSPLSYPLPLLSLTTHLALLRTRLPALVSEKDEDPHFNDDWEAATLLYPQSDQTTTRPPVTLLVMSVGDNIIFDPSKDELAVADAVLTVSIGKTPSSGLRLLSVRTVDPPSRLTAPGVPNSTNSANGDTAPPMQEALMLREAMDEHSLWRPPRGGMKRALVGRMIKMVVDKNGVGEEVLEGLEGVDKALEECITAIEAKDTETAKQWEQERETYTPTTIDELIVMLNPINTALNGGRSSRVWMRTKDDVLNLKHRVVRRIAASDTINNFLMDMWAAEVHRASPSEVWLN
ncbi:Exosome complex component rrp42 [Elasticomyces elasticus]|nr:Exosome complex component rrp42 [Elasticomyces elasticus]